MKKNKEKLKEIRKQKNCKTKQKKLENKKF